MAWHFAVWRQKYAVKFGRRYTGGHAIKQPLYERHPRHPISGGEILHTLKVCETLITQQCSKFTGADVPTQADLQKELSWLLEDSICSNYAVQNNALKCNWPAPLRSSAAFKRAGLDSDNFLSRLSQPDILKLWEKRVQDRVPLQYLTSTSHWRDLVLSVGPGVLIPRPETECIIDFVEQAVQRSETISHLPWADLGCGSGALACALGRLLQRFNSTQVPTVYACDISPVALNYTKYNAERTGVADVVAVREGSWCEPLRKLDGALGGIVSNPPYIPEQRLPYLQEEVGRHEPRMALIDDSLAGTSCLTTVVECAAKLLASGGFLALETDGVEQSRDICAMIKGMQTQSGGEGCFTDVRQQNDYFGVQRFVTAVKV